MDDGDEERLRRYEALVHASPDFIAIADIDAKVQFLNRAGRRLIGIGDDVDLSQTVISDFLTEEGLQASIEVEQPAVVRDGFWSGISTLRDWRGGPPIPVAISSFLICDLTTGAPLAFATVQRDLRESLATAAAAARAQTALVESEHRQRALLRHLSDVLLVVSANRTVLYASPSTSRVLGYAEGSLEGSDVLDLVHPDDRDRTRAALRDVAAVPGESATFEMRLLGVAGAALSYEALADNHLDNLGVAGIVVAARDITDRRRHQLSEAAVARVLELIAGEAPLAVVLESLAAWVEGELEGTYCSILLAGSALADPPHGHGASPELPAAHRAALAAVQLEGGASPCTAALTDGTPVLVPDLEADARWPSFQDVAGRYGVRCCWCYPVRSPATGRTLGTFALYRREPGEPDAGLAALVARASHLVGIAVDRYELLARLSHQATHDELTGLPNRHSLLEVLSAELERHRLQSAAGPVVVFLDLDRLKIVNDSLGHQLGDELLAEIAGRLPAAIPEGAFVSRFGGDEFVVVAGHPHTQQDVERLAGRVLDAVNEPAVLAGRHISPSASAGVVVATAGQTAHEVLRDADIAMYRAKRRGGAGFEIFGPEMRQRAFDRLELEGQIREGLAREEFRVFYQPIVDLRAQDALVGFEALVRWAHPQRGLLLPGQFIDLTEETGQIVELGEWVLSTAAATLATWAEQVPGRDLALSVNVAARQLSSPALLPAVRAAVQRLAPWTLTLELTESTLMGSTEAASAVIDELATTGARLAIDDFGTGFSSLAYLTRLPVRTLKIDRSFVHDLPGSVQAASVAASVLGLAEQLDLSVVAEGIETAAQRDSLAQMGCSYGQGYLFGQALPAEQARALLDDRAAPQGGA